MQLAALAVVPIVTYVLIWTMPARGLLHRSAVIDDSGPFAVLQLTYGPLFWAQAWHPTPASPSSWLSRTACPPCWLHAAIWTWCSATCWTTPIKFSPRGSKITLSARTDGDNVVIAVADQGIGIPAEQLDMIFARFYQIDSTPTRRFGGMGIGLALCQAIVAAHSGRIWAECAGPNQGSTFLIALPVAPIKDSETGTPWLGENV